MELYSLLCDDLNGEEIQKEGTHAYMDFPGGSGLKNLPANAGNTGSIPESGRSVGEGNGNSLHYSCLGDPMDRGSCWGRVHGVRVGYNLVIKQ